MSLKRSLTTKIMLSLAAGMFSIAPFAQAMPSGLTSETATQATADKVMTITGTATNNLLKWNSFSIANGETVTFANKNNYLNVVTGKEASQIFGSLTGGGTVYLINPNGILFGSTAQVNVGNLVASTRSLTDEQMSAFTTNGTNPIVETTTTSAAGDITNLGTIKASSVVIEGNNVILKSTSDITNSSGSMLSADRDKKSDSVLTGNVMVKAAGTIKIGYEDTKNAKDSAGNQVSYQKYDSGNTARKLGYILSDLQGFKATEANTSDKASKAELTKQAASLMADNKYQEYMLVHNAAELQNISSAAKTVTTKGEDGSETSSNVFDGNYFLTNDIDASGVDFVPLAGSAVDFTKAVAFTGDFNGLGYTIKNLTIADTNGDYHNNLGGVGLFAQIGGNGVVENLTVQDAKVSVKAKDKGNVGIIAGVSKGNISNVTVSGKVTGSTETATGGIVGDAQGGLVTNVINKATVDTGKRIGGIIGIVEKNGKLDNAVNEGSVQGVFGGKGAGGIVGENQGKISNVSHKGKLAMTDSKGNASTAATIKDLVGLETSGSVTEGTATATGNSLFIYTAQDTPADPGTKPSDQGKTDTGKTDTGNTDTGKTDTGKSDTGNTDTGKTDTGKTDTGNTDTGKTDTGKTDTGKTDSGKTNTGSTDTGKTDTGKTDSGTQPVQPAAEPNARPYAGKAQADLTETEQQAAITDAAIAANSDEQVTERTQAGTRRTVRRAPRVAATTTVVPGSFVVTVQGTATNVAEDSQQ